MSLNGKILMNKNTLEALKIDLEEYGDALPVFEMKEQQLKVIVHGIEDGISILERDINRSLNEVKKWVSVMAEKDVELSNAVKVARVVTEEEEIAGVTVDAFVEILFEDGEIDYFNSPLWIDDAIEVIKLQKIKKTILKIERRKYELLHEELAEARRMKNALKEVFIPETIKSIRKIEIYLGDVERLAIGCAKLVKKKKENHKMPL
jgi:V/A-type H+-transporting ATPase subunit D